MHKNEGPKYSDKHEWTTVLGIWAGVVILAVAGAKAELDKRGVFPFVTVDPNRGVAAGMVANKYWGDEALRWLFTTVGRDKYGDGFHGRVKLHDQHNEGFDGAGVFWGSTPTPPTAK